MTNVVKFRARDMPLEDLFENMLFACPKKGCKMVSGLGSLVVMENNESTFVCPHCGGDILRIRTGIELREAIQALRGQNWTLSYCYKCGKVIGGNNAYGYTDSKGWRHTICAGES